MYSQRKNLAGQDTKNIKKGLAAQGTHEKEMIHQPAQLDITKFVVAPVHTHAVPVTNCSPFEPHPKPIISRTALIDSSTSCYVGFCFLGRLCSERRNVVGEALASLESVAVRLCKSGMTSSPGASASAAAVAASSRAASARRAVLATRCASTLGAVASAATLAVSRGAAIVACRSASFSLAASVAKFVSMISNILLIRARLGPILSMSLKASFASALPSWGSV